MSNKIKLIAGEEYRRNFKVEVTLEMIDEEKKEMCKEMRDTRWVILDDLADIIEKK